MDRAHVTVASGEHVRIGPRSGYFVCVRHLILGAAAVRHEPMFMWQQMQALLRSRKLPRAYRTG